MKQLVYYFLRLGVVALAGYLATAWPSSTAAQDVNSYTIIRATGPITLDGKLDEGAWKNAKEAELTDTVTGKPAPLKSTVRVLWDDTNLYVGFYCEDPDAWATLTNEDDPLWGEEVVEMFIDPDCNEHNYYELEINPVNAKVDLYVLSAGKRLNGRMQGWFDWDFKNLTSAVYVDGDGKNIGTKDKYWTVEVAIPFDDLWELSEIPPKDGDVWRMNLYRIERGKPDDKNDDWYVAFNPTKRGSFHTPWEFGKFTFKK